MSSRDRRLAETKYKGRTSASSEAKAKKEARSRVPADAGGSVLDQLKNFSYAEPKPVQRDRASFDRAAAHKRNLPPLGGS